MGGELIFLDGRADISGGVCLCLWRGGLIFLEGVFMFVEGRAAICRGRADIS